MVSIGSKLLKNNILFRLRDAVDKYLSEEQCGFRKGGGCVDQIFTLRLIIEECLSCQKPLGFSFIDYAKFAKLCFRKVLTLVWYTRQIHKSD